MIRISGLVVLLASAAVRSSGPCLRITIQQDEKADDLYWRIMETGKSVNSDSGWGEARPGSFNQCLMLWDGCFSVRFKENGADGLCCDHGEGFIKIEVEDARITSRGGAAVEIAKFADPLEHSWDAWEANFCWPPKNLPKMPDPPKWGDWGAWSTCSISCYKQRKHQKEQDRGIQFRERICHRAAPEECERMFGGLWQEARACGEPCDSDVQPGENGGHSGDVHPGENGGESSQSNECGNAENRIECDANTQCEWDRQVSVCLKASCTGPNCRYCASLNAKKCKRQTDTCRYEKKSKTCVPA